MCPTSSFLSYAIKIFLTSPIWSKLSTVKSYVNLNNSLNRYIYRSTCYTVRSHCWSRFRDPILTLGIVSLFYILQRVWVNHVLLKSVLRKSHRFFMKPFTITSTTNDSLLPCSIIYHDPGSPTTGPRAFSWLHLTWLCLKLVSRQKVVGFTVIEFYPLKRM